jgi:ferredoxin
MPKSKVEFKPENCMACGQCIEICRHGALSVVSKAHGYSRVEKDDSKCVNCFDCMTEIDCSGGCFVWAVG